MLALARGLMAAPKLLLLDEPALGLAPVTTAAVFALIARLKAEGATVLLVEQNVAEALAVADRGYVLESGRVVKSGAGANLARDPELREAYLGLRRETPP
jgi:branched-chain amino acid transport system ATP-binding protein